MRSFKILAVMLLAPTPLFAWGGYYSAHRAPAKTTAPSGSDDAPVQPPTAGRISDVGTSGTSPRGVGFSASPVGGTLISSPGAASGNESGFSTPIHSLADKTLNNPGQPAPAPGTTTSGQLGSLLGSLGANAGTALGGAGLGGAAGNGSCPSNMHSVANANGGQNCVSGAPTQ